MAKDKPAPSGKGSAGGKPAGGAAPTSKKGGSK